MSREDIEFRTRDGLKLTGWLYLPDGVEGELPAIIVAHGFTAVKEMALDTYGQAFADAGFAAVVYDHRNFGTSEGEPRQEVNPHDQRADYKDAVTFAQNHPRIDPNRVGIWGTSYSAGTVVEVGAVDRRVKAVVAQAPVASGYWNVRRLSAERDFPALLGLIDEARASEAAGEKPTYLKVVSDDPNELHAIPGENSFNFFTQYKNDGSAPNWENETTVRSVEYFLEYDPSVYYARVSPTPLLMIVATEDTTTPTDLALQMYESALEPKELVLIKGHHYGSYVDEFEASSKAAVNFFRKHL